MFRYVLKQLFWFIPTLFCVTLLSFFLLVHATGDPVGEFIHNSGNTTTTESIDHQRHYWRKELGLNLPLFYFSMTKLSEPTTLYQIDDPQQLKTYKAFLCKTGNSETIDSFFTSLRHCQTSFNKGINSYKSLNLRPHQNIAAIEKNIHVITISLNDLYTEPDFSVQNHYLNQIKCCSQQLPKELSCFFEPLYISVQKLQSNYTVYKNYIPTFIWHGSNNRYHQWLFGNKHSKGILRGDFGLSYSKKESVMSILKPEIRWSVGFALISVILAYGISIPLGIKIAEKPHRRWSKTFQFILFAAYAIPPFFMSVLLLMLFANPDCLSVFPPSGVKPIGGYSHDSSLISRVIESLPYLILPLVCYTYSSLAFITQLTTASVNEQLYFDYIKTAKAKGLSDKQVIWKHAFKNSFLPLISVCSYLFPSLVGGSIIIESIFTIPGIGLETVRSIRSHDYPVVVAIVTFSTTVTLLSYLVADVLYTWLDPRIKPDKP